MAKIGYARVSTLEQNLDSQVAALEKAGCDRIYQDVTSGIKASRPGLDQAFDYLRPGDTFVVWKLDRLGRSLKHLMKHMNWFKRKEIHFCSLQENIDTSTSSGKLIFHIMGSIAEFERDIIRQRTDAGLKAARARGIFGGRPRKMDNTKIELAKTMIHEKGMSVTSVSKSLGVSRATLYRYFALDKD